MRGASFIGVQLLALLACADVIAGDLAVAIRLALEPTRNAYVFLHENPELGKQETKAQAYLKRTLLSLGFTDFVASSQAPTAVIAVLDSGKPGPVVALRAEMDARPLEAGAAEPASHAPRSQVDGVMHNCGHDIHASILLGTAAIMMANRDRFVGKLVFLFQPAEETAGGADDIVREGILARLGVQSIFALHVAPNMPIGTIAIGPGFSLAGSNSFHLKIKGKKALMPRRRVKGRDTPLVAARMARELSEYPARHLDIANRPVIISVTRLHADGSASNVIPADAELSGTIRSFENIAQGSDGQPPLREKLERVISRMAAEAGVDYEWTVKAGAPPTRNDVVLFDRVIRPLMQAWPGTLDTHPGRGMFAEDFAYYTQSTPALYFSLGLSKDGLGSAGVHTVEFNAHPEVFGHGLRLMTTLAIIATTGRMDWP